MKNNPNQFLAFDKRQDKFILNVVITASGNPFITRITDELNYVINEYYKSKGDILFSDCDVIDYTDYYAIENIVICRFTGLFDVAGEPIYENQIVLSNNEKYFVEFNKNVFYFKHINTEFTFSFSSLFNVKIIGNIFQRYKII